MSDGKLTVDKSHEWVSLVEGGADCCKYHTLPTHSVKAGPVSRVDFIEWGVGWGVGRPKALYSWALCRAKS